MAGFAKPIDQQGQEEVWKAIGRHLRTTIFGEKGSLPYSASNKYSLDLNPVESFDREKNPEGAIFSEPAVPMSESQIRGVATPAAKFLRKMMQTEFKARGPRPKTGTDDDIYSTLLRGTWFRGQEETPKIIGMSDAAKPRVAHRGQRWTGRSDLRTEEPGTGNVGEPRGISLSYDPATARYFAKENIAAYPQSKLTGKASELQYTAMNMDDSPKKEQLLALQKKLLSKAEVTVNPGERKKINRMLPMFEGAPEKNILVATKPEHGAILNEEYTKAANRMMELYPLLRKEVIKGREFYKSLENAAPHFSAEFDDVNPVRHFNELLTEGLKARGYKGLLHSPHRYSEYELRMFDPQDVIHLDKRRAPVAKSELFTYHKPWEERSSVARLRDAKVPLQEEHVAMTKGKTGAHLYEWYRQIPEEALAGKWAKPRERYLKRLADAEYSDLDFHKKMDKLNMTNTAKPSEFNIYYKEAEKILKKVGSDSDAVKIADTLVKYKNTDYGSKVLNSMYLGGLITKESKNLIKALMISEH